MVLYAWALAKYGPSEIKKYARHFFNGVLDVFAYQLAAKGGLFSSGDEMFTLSGLDVHGGFANVTDAQIESMAGIPYDANVESAGAHV
jgi:hypothetical protein